ncbi:MAG: hypothetical protein AVDCRST_MAG07-1031 [uncultured Frankineae bacterium]|uniref:Uncharacterized protein n=1 Tax=uncultured Frankineae bacterium TaxID=437475 RepID=A0A6J4KGI6_9ACTN|nr:MAG: hypothetical protein AVDCRST_MAG07-1031 [uncultured Frankineae bacterium]
MSARPSYRPVTATVMITPGRAGESRVTTTIAVGGGAWRGEP